MNKHVMQEFQDRDDLKVGRRVRKLLSLPGSEMSIAESGGLWTVTVGGRTYASDSLDGATESAVFELVFKATPGGRKLMGRAAKAEGGS